MQKWKKVVSAGLPGLFLLILLIVFLRRCYLSRKGRNFKETTKRHTEGLQSGILKLHLQYDNKKFSSFHQIQDFDKKRRSNYYGFRLGLSSKSLFNWSNNPLLISEAVENGWSGFGFTSQGRESEVEISWVVHQGSSDFMQKIKFKSGLKKGIVGSSNSSSFNGSSVIKTDLPLPGPYLGNYSFPQEAYFEITILSFQDDDDDDYGDGDGVESVRPNAKQGNKKKEGGKSKLIEGPQDVESPSDSLAHIASSKKGHRFEEVKVVNKEEGKDEGMMMSLGLTLGGIFPNKLPGSYPGSIGFNSKGSVYLEGKDLMFEAVKAKWEMKNKVIGCGFDPNKKKVYFTVDSELVHVVNCTSEEFTTPLYPTLAANTEATILVNLGQNSFNYAPANVQRTSNPCFLGSLSLGFEDSRELFSIGMADSQSSNRSTTIYSSNQNNNNGGRVLAFDVDGDSETDFYDIILDNRNRHPNTFKSEV